MQEIIILATLAFQLLWTHSYDLIDKLINKPVEDFQTPLVLWETDEMA